MKEYDIAQMTDDEFEEFIGSKNVHEVDDEIRAIGAGLRIEAQQRREQKQREDVEARR